jgi:hypothetical protein
MANAGSSITNPVWKTLWKLKVPGKVIISLWRALHGILPLKSILANRHIGTSGECPICHQGAEDILHLIFQCDTVRELWAKLGLENIISNAIVVWLELDQQSWNIFYACKTTPFQDSI